MGTIDSFDFREAVADDRVSRGFEICRDAEWKGISGKRRRRI